MFTYITAFGAFVTIFHVKMMFLSPVLKLTRIAFSDPENMPVAYTNFLSIASCHIVNIQYRNDLLITEILVVNSAVRVRFSSENCGILKDCWMKLLDSCV